MSFGNVFAADSLRNSMTPAIMAILHPQKTKSLTIPAD